MIEQAAVVQVPADLWADIRGSLEQSGCQFWACEGPTLQPIDMVTCHTCATLARVRALTGDES